jgi:hypothetical protein
VERTAAPSGQDHKVVIRPKETQSTSTRDGKAVIQPFTLWSAQLLHQGKTATRFLTKKKGTFFNVLFFKLFASKMRYRNIPRSLFAIKSAM